MVNGISKLDSGISLAGKVNLPSLILEDGEMATRRFVEFFTAQIRNKGTRAVYGNAVFDFFDWCTARNIALHQIEPIIVAGYIEDVSRHLASKYGASRLMSRNCPAFQASSFSSYTVLKQKQCACK